jgi:hypothetical protein
MHLLKSMGLWRQTVGPDESVTWTGPWARTMADPPLEPPAPAPAWLLAADHADDCPF